MHLTKRSGKKDREARMEYYGIKGENRMLCRRSATFENLETAVKAEFAGVFAWILFWEQYRVDFAWYDGEQIHWPEEKKAERRFLLEARIFREDKEVVLRRMESGVEFQARVLEEQDKNTDLLKPVAYRFIEEPVMWGSQIENGCISEERGMQYHLPFLISSDQVAFGYQMAVYRIPSPEDGMLQLLDYRMTGIYQKIGQKKHYLEGR